MTRQLIMAIMAATADLEKLSSGRKFTAFFSVLLPKEGLHFWGHLSECIVYIDYKSQALGVGEKLNSERLY